MASYLGSAAIRCDCRGPRRHGQRGGCARRRARQARLGHRTVSARARSGIESWPFARDQARVLRASGLRAAAAPRVRTVAAARISAPAEASAADHRRLDDRPAGQRSRQRQPAQRARTSSRPRDARCRRQIRAAVSRADARARRPLRSSKKKPASSFRKKRSARIWTSRSITARTCTSTSAWKSGSVASSGTIVVRTSRGRYETERLILAPGPWASACSRCIGCRSKSSRSNCTGSSRSAAPRRSRPIDFRSTSGTSATAFSSTGFPRTTKAESRSRFSARK